MQSFNKTKESIHSRTCVYVKLFLSCDVNNSLLKSVRVFYVHPVVFISSECRQ
jgi:hypothetical protein